MNVRPLRTLRALAAGAYVAARTARDRVLHPLRHRRARARVSGMARPGGGRLLVLCYGNVCRSPYLEARLRASIPGFAIVSAGMAGPGRPVPANGLAVASRRGLDLAAHRSQLVTPALAAEAQLVIVMDIRQRRYLSSAFGISGDRIVLAGDLDPIFENGRVIRDPWQQPIEVFEASYARLDRCAAVLGEVLRPVAPTPQF